MFTSSENTGCLHSAWFLIAMPFIALLCGLGLYMGYVPDEELESCAGKVENLEMDGRKKFVNMLQQANLVFKIQNCRHPVLGLEGVGLFGNPLDKLFSELDTENEVRVWFTKDQDVSVNARLARRISINGNVIFDYMDFIHLFGALFYPVIFFTLLWVYSLSRNLLKKKEKQTFSASPVQNFRESHSTVSASPVQINWESRPSVSTTLLVFPNEEGMLKALQQEAEKNPQKRVVTWFLDMSQKLQEKTGIQAHYAGELPPDASGNRSLIVAGIHPSAKKEQEAWEKAGVLEALVFLSLDDFFLKTNISGSTLHMLKGLGLKEDGFISHNMVTQSIRKLQQEIDLKVSTDFSGASVEDWLKINNV